MLHWLNVIPVLLFKAANDGRSNSDGETPDKLATFNKLMLIDSWKAFLFTTAVRFNTTVRIDFHQSAYFGKNAAIVQQWVDSQTFITHFDVSFPACCYWTHSAIFLRHFIIF